MPEVSQWILRGLLLLHKNYLQSCTTKAFLCKKCFIFVFRRNDRCSPVSTSLETMTYWRSWDSPLIPMWSRHIWRSCLLVSTVWSLMTMPSTSWPWNPWMERWCHCSGKSRSCQRWRYVSKNTFERGGSVRLKLRIHCFSNTLSNLDLKWMDLWWNILQNILKMKKNEDSHY